MFFSEEKNQKTFVSAQADACRPWPENEGQPRIKSLLGRAGRASAFSSEKNTLDA